MTTHPPREPRTPAPQEALPYRPLPQAARVLLHAASLLPVAPAFLLGALAPDGSFPSLPVLVQTAIATLITLATHRALPRLDSKLRLHLSPFLTALPLSFTLASWGLLIGLLL